MPWDFANPLSRRLLLTISGGLATGALTSEAHKLAAQTTPLAQGTSGASGAKNSAPPEPSVAPSSASAAEVLGSLIWDLIAANRILAAQGIVDGYGHVSARSTSNPDRYFLSSHMAPEAVTPDDLIEFDFESAPIDRRGRSMQSERFIHGCIYRVRPDVNAVVHMHAPPTVLMSVSGEPLRPMYHMAGFIGHGVPTFEIREVAGMSDMLISSVRLGSALAAALGDKPAILLRGHGAAVVGKDLAEATGRAVYLTINAQLQSQVLGRKIEFLSTEEARLAAQRAAGFAKDWDLWKAKAMLSYSGLLWSK